LISRHFGDKDKRLIPSDIREDLAKRNPKLPMSLGPFKPSNPLVVLDDQLASETSIRFVHAHPNARGWVKFWVPGYSSDEATAVVIFSCGRLDGKHPQFCAVGLAKKKGSWAVIWRRRTYYI
jgi:hypothetical protein